MFQAIKKQIRATFEWKTVGSYCKLKSLSQPARPEPLSELVPRSAGVSAPDPYSAPFDHLNKYIVWSELQLDSMQSELINCNAKKNLFLNWCSKAGMSWLWLCLYHVCITYLFRSKTVILTSMGIAEASAHLSSSYRRVDQESSRTDTCPPS